MLCCPLCDVCLVYVLCDWCSLWCCIIIIIMCGIVFVVLELFLCMVFLCSCMCNVVLLLLCLGLFKYLRCACGIWGIVIVLWC